MKKDIAFVEPVWLSHHTEEQKDLCFQWKGLHLCRRCFSMYPVTLLTAFIIFVLELDPSWAVVIVLPIPSTIETWLLTTRKTMYNKRLSFLLSLMTGFAFGAGVGSFWQDWTSLKFWVPIFIFTPIWWIVWVTNAKKLRS